MPGVMSDAGSRQLHASSASTQLLPAQQAVRGRERSLIAFILQESPRPFRSRVCRRAAATLQPRAASRVRRLMRTYPPTTNAIVARKMAVRVRITAAHASANSPFDISTPAISQPLHEQWAHTRRLEVADRPVLPE